MTTRMRHLRDDERGMSLVFVCVGFTSLLAATTLAIDVGMFMNSRNQAQNSADAGALAGAVALAYDSYTNRTAGGPAVLSAIHTAEANTVAAATVSVVPADVTFPLGPTGVDNRVKVDVFRSTARMNPVATLMGSFFGVDTVDITATATAEASKANAATCVKPFTIPDKWIENGTGPWDPDDTFDLLDNKGKPVANPDVYIPADQPGYTGYNADRDRGLQLILKSDNSTKVAPSFYNPWAMSGGTGASFYEENIAQCNTTIIPIGTLMDPEPGMMTGPTAQGTDRLIDRDPSAYWDTGCKCVKGSAFAKSPRVAVIPVYDPVYFEEGKHTGRGASLRIANYLGFFIEGMNGGQVVGRITPIGGVFNNGAGPAPAGAFPTVIRLVQ
jgi:Putative Flp pilus-assembly TadE/G-like